MMQEPITTSDVLRIKTAIQTKIGKRIEKAISHDSDHNGPLILGFRLVSVASESACLNSTLCAFPSHCQSWIGKGILGVNITSRVAINTEATTGSHSRATLRG